MKKFKVGDRVKQIIYTNNTPVGIIVQTDSYPISVHIDSVVVQTISEKSILTVWKKEDLELDVEWYREQSLSKLI